MKIMMVLFAAAVMVNSQGVLAGMKHQKHVSAKAAHQAAGTSAVAVPQKTCPVMGGAINKEIHVDHNGKRVYLCCAGCVETFKKDPDRYLAKLDSLGESPEVLAPAVQTTCPVMGGAINKDVYADYEGKRVYFCCPGCDKRRPKPG